MAKFEATPFATMQAAPASPRRNIITRRATQRLPISQVLPGKQATSLMWLPRIECSLVHTATLLLRKLPAQQASFQKSDSQALILFVGLSGGGAAGIAVGCVALVAIPIAVFVFCLKSKKGGKGKLFAHMEVGVVFGPFSLHLRIVEGFFAR